MVFHRIGLRLAAVTTLACVAWAVWSSVAANQRPFNLYETVAFRGLNAFAAANGGRATDCGEVTNAGPGNVRIRYMTADFVGPGVEGMSDPVKRNVVDPPMRMGEIVLFESHDGTDVSNVRRAECFV